MRRPEYIYRLRHSDASAPEAGNALHLCNAKLQIAFRLTGFI
jgi:hypothetical protein